LKRVFLTGATGFIGQQCVASLIENGFEVHAVSSKVVPELFNAAQWHQADLFDSSQVQALMQTVQPTHLLHLAWYAVPGKFWASLENLRWVQASLCLLAEFARQGGTRVVMAGTCAEYDWHSGTCSEETTPLLPTTLYATCKHSLQMMLSASAAQMGLSAAWGRVFFLYGPHEYPERLVASVIRSLLKEEPARCSHGEQVRDFLHVTDVAGAFVALLDSDVSGPINIASGQPVMLKEVIYQIAEIIGRPDLVQLGAIPASLGDPPFLLASVNRLREEVGWQPQISLVAGLRDTIDWWRSQYGPH